MEGKGTKCAKREGSAWERRWLEGVGLNRGTVTSNHAWFTYEGSHINSADNWFSSISKSKWIKQCIHNIFLSLYHAEVEYICQCAMLGHSVLSSSLWHHGLQPARLLWTGDSPGKNTGMGCHAFLQRIFPIRDWTQVYALQADSLPTESPGKSKNMVGSLSLIFPIQESNRGLLHCWQILYQLS